MTIADIEQRMEEAGMDSSNLDEIVHKAASDMASNANNEGLKGQIGFLLIACGWEHDEIYKALGLHVEDGS